MGRNAKIGDEAAYSLINKKPNVKDLIKEIYRANYFCMNLAD